MHQLKRLDSFAHLRWNELNTIAQHTQLLSIPRSRWLLRPGRRLTGAYFLARGRLRLWSPERQLAATERSAGQPFYPGASAVFALSDVQLLQVDTRPIAFLLESAGAQMAGLDISSEPWLVRFLDSALMRRLDTQRWQRVLRGMSSLSAQRGDTVLREGQPGHHFYVIKQGQAVVHRGQQSLAYLGSGDFFGEDALIAGTPRNASVTALGTAEFMRLPRGAFLDLLVRGVVPRVQRIKAAGTRTRLLNVGVPPLAGALQLPLHDLRLHCPLLSRDCSYYIVGGAPRARTLAAFLLLQRGFKAWVLQDSPAQPV
ncbi:MAG: cyclic nucleotide-binding domain-containing protein [Pseudomonadales bacterium]